MFDIFEERSLVVLGLEVAMVYGGNREDCFVDLDLVVLWK